MAGNLLACPRPYKSKFALDDSEVVCIGMYVCTCSIKTVAKKRGGHMKQFAVGLID